MSDGLRRTYSASTSGGGRRSRPPSAGGAARPTSAQRRQGRPQSARRTNTNGVIPEGNGVTSAHVGASVQGYIDEHNTLGEEEDDDAWLFVTESSITMAEAIDMEFNNVSILDCREWNVDETNVIAQMAKALDFDEELREQITGLNLDSKAAIEEHLYNQFCCGDLLIVLSNIEYNEDQRCSERVEDYITRVLDMVSNAYYRADEAQEETLGGIMVVVEGAQYAYTQFNGSWGSMYEGMQQQPHHDHSHGDDPLAIGYTAQPL
eukprot:GFYU01015062.1.p1 GENE.GFYU01015062.1~~GFYU01015062.1.p1  ORF type:complete len:302 (+),score=70.41 GFYU01015062.1:118-906(+)